MINFVFNFAFLVILATMAASLFIKFSGLPFWIGALFLAGLAAVLYIGNILLIRHYIEKGVPGLLDIDGVLPPPRKGQSYFWEMTAGTGIVPKWVSWIGIGAIACVIGGCVWLAIWLWA
jgi:hypothetical protein